MSAIFEATVGRRLLVRIWFHGVLLFAGVIAAIMIARWMMAGIDQAMAMRHSPYLAIAVADTLLARRGDRALLIEEVERAAAETSLSISIYAADKTLLASSIDPPLFEEERGPRDRGGRQLVVPALEDGRVVASAVILIPSAPSLAWHAVALISGALILAFVFVGAPLTLSIVRPLERLRTLARELGAGNLAVRASSARHDEIGDLARSFDAMAAQLQHLRAAERELLGGVSHELRTPLARMRVVLDLASDADPERMRRYLGEITTDLAELEQLVDDIIASARLDQAQPPLRKATIAIDDPIDAALARFRARWPDRTIHTHRAGENLLINADPTLVRRALDNLLDNARLYSADNTQIELRVARVENCARIEVIDQGIGIAPEDHARVFSAFFRADRSRSRSSGGVGLGLVLTRRIIEAHGGTISFESAVDRGSRFSFELPLSEA